MLRIFLDIIVALTIVWVITTTAIVTLALVAVGRVARDFDKAAKP